MGMMLAGCSKEENGNMEENVKRAEQTQHDYFEEPILDFSLTLEQLKARDTHRLLGDGKWEPGADDPKGATAPWLVRYAYTHQDGVFTVTYYWTDKGGSDIYAVSIDWSGQSGISKEAIHQQMISRYGVPYYNQESGAERYYSATYKLSIIETATAIKYYPAE